MFTAEEFEKKLNYTFKNIELLRTALTHSSYANEVKGGNGSNERLEFLGDSVLSICVSEKLFAQVEKLAEGELTRHRSALVCEASLCEIAKHLELGQYIMLGKGEKAGGGANRPSILADALEAVIAAIYLDGGIRSARKFVNSQLANGRRTDDYKTLLQEIVQKNGGAAPTYAITHTEGPAHDLVFYAEVVLKGKKLGEGSAKSKKSAEQEAARQAIELIKN